MFPVLNAFMLTGLVLFPMLAANWSCKKKQQEPPLSVPASVESPTVRVDMTIKEQTFRVELAFRRSDRMRGLMGREHLPTDAGMLFVFEREHVRSFYMKNCLIDLDILFLDEQGQIVHLTTMTKPEPDQPLLHYSSQEPMKYALELAAGTIERLQLAKGDTIELPPRARAVLPDRD